jgi:PAS domain S-box-containing protein
MNIGAAGWVSFGSFFLWFILIFTEREKILKAKISYLVIFLPPAFLVYKQWTAASLIEQYLRQPYGWSYLYSKSIWHYVFYAWYLSCLLLAFYLCIDYGNRTKDRSKKILANLMYLSAIPIMIAGTINSVILQKLNIHSIPIFTDIYVFGWLFSVVYAINKYKFLTITPSVAAETIIASMADAFILLDPSGNIVTVNQAMMALIGYKQDELVGNYADMVFKEEASVNKIIMAGLSRQSSISGREVLLNTKTGGVVPVLLSASVIKDKMGVVSGIVMIGHDITNRKKSEKDLQDAYNKLKEMQNQLVQVEKLNAVGQLASGVAHEVRNPLAVVIQGINYLETKIPDKKEGLRETLNMVKDSVKRANNIISALLDFSKATTLDLKSEYISFILENSLVLVKINLERGKINVIRQLDAGLPAVLADRNKIEQVFVNILLNAIQAMPDGGDIVVRGYVKQLSEVKNGIGRRQNDSFKLGEKVVMVEFEDTGIGISEENLTKVFDPFFTTKGPSGGTGLGLSVTKNILNMHKGLISVTSKVGKGTKVTLTLKIA